MLLLCTKFKITLVSNRDQSMKFLGKQGHESKLKCECTGHCWVVRGRLLTGDHQEGWSIFEGHHW